MMQWKLSLLQATTGVFYDTHLNCTVNMRLQTMSKKVTNVAGRCWVMSMFPHMIHEPFFAGMSCP